MAELQTSMPEAPAWVTAGAASMKGGSWLEGARVGLAAKEVDMRSKALDLQKQQFEFTKQREGLLMQKTQWDLDANKRGLADVEKVSAGWNKYNETHNVGDLWTPTTPQGMALDAQNRARSTEYDAYIKTRNAETDLIAKVNADYPELQSLLSEALDFPYGNKVRRQMMTDIGSRVRQIESQRKYAEELNKAQAQAAPRREIADIQSQSRENVAAIQAESRERIARENNQNRIDVQKLKPTATGAAAKLPDEVKMDLDRIKKAYPTARDSEAYTREKQRILEAYRDKLAGLEPLPRNPWQQKLDEANDKLLRAKKSLVTAEQVHKKVLGVISNPFSDKVDDPAAVKAAQDAETQKNKIQNEFDKWDNEHNIDRSRPRLKTDSMEYRLADAEARLALSEYEREDLQNQINDMSEWDPATGDYTDAPTR